MLWGAGFVIFFVYSFAAFVLQYIIVNSFSSEIIIHPPTQPVECGSRVDARYEIRHGFPVFPGMRIGTGVRFSWHDRVISDERRYRKNIRYGSFHLSANRRGEYRSRGAYFRLRDVSGFFDLMIIPGSEERLTVKPGQPEIDDFPHMMSSGGSNLSIVLKKKRSDDLIDSRQYYPGDDVRRINWKTYAHLGELFIRLGEELPNPESKIKIIADLSGCAEQILGPEQSSLYLDYCVSTLSSVIRNLRERGISPDFKIRTLPGLWWGNEAVEAEPGTGVLVFSSAFSDKAESLCSSALKKGCPAGVFIAVPPAEPAAEISLLSKLLMIKDDRPVRAAAAAEAAERAAAELASSLSVIKGIADVRYI